MRFERNYGTAESKSYWDRLDRAVDEIRERREQAVLAPTSPQNVVEQNQDTRRTPSEEPKQSC